MPKEAKEVSVYFLECTCHPNKPRSYIGFSNRSKTRLRKHNERLSGAAKSTAGHQWAIKLLATGFLTKGEALSFEHNAKHAKYGTAGTDTKLSRRERGFRACLLAAKWAHIRLV